MYDVEFRQMVRKTRFYFPFKHQYKVYDANTKGMVYKSYQNGAKTYAEIRIFGIEDIDFRQLDEVLVDAVHETSKFEDGFHNFGKFTIEDACKLIAIACSRELKSEVEVELCVKDYSVTQHVSYVPGVDVEAINKEYPEVKKKEEINDVREYVKEMTGEDVRFSDGKIV